MKRRRSSRTAAALLASFFLHLLFLLTVQWPEELEKILRPVRFHQSLPEPERFEPAPRRYGPGVQMERLVVQGKPEDLDVDAVVYRLVSELPPPPALFTVLEAPRLQGEKAARFVAPVDSLISLDELNLDAMRQRLEELAQYDRLWLPDADTDDIDSQQRSMAQQIVLEAIEAMGGLQALTRLRSMALGPLAPPSLGALARMETTRTAAEIQNRLVMGHYFFKSYSLRSRYAQYLPGGTRLVYDGARAWFTVQGRRYPVTGENLRLLQNRAERWDFLSRYLGDGVRVTYAGVQEEDSKPPYHVIQVEDWKFGGVSFRAFFDQQTHLLASEEYPSENPTLRKRYIAYQPVDQAYIWTQVETTRLLAWRFASDTLAVSYAPLGDELFLPDRAAGSGSGLDTHEFVGTLWVDARFGTQSYDGRRAITREALGLIDDKVENREYGRRASPDIHKYYLSYEQKRMVETQVEEIARTELQRYGLFFRVAVLENKQDTQPDDYVLKLRPLSKRAEDEIRGRVFYGAELFAGDTNELLMRDGPLPDFYFGKAWGGTISGLTDSSALFQRRECRFYRMTVYGVEGHLAYVSERRLRELLQRTIQKLTLAVGTHQSGAIQQYLGYCCYCQKP